MEDEVKLGIDRFTTSTQQALPGVELVIPVKASSANFLISLTYQGHRTYITIHEDDFADWGEGRDLDKLEASVSNSIKKLLAS